MREVPFYRQANDAVGDADLHVVPGQEPGTPEADERDLAPLPAVQDDVVPDPVGLVREDGDAGEEVRQGVLGREAKGQTQDSRRGHQPCDVDLPGDEDPVDPCQEEENGKSVPQERLRRMLDEVESLRMTTHGPKDHLGVDQRVHARADEETHAHFVERAVQDHSMDRVQDMDLRRQ